MRLILIEDNAFMAYDIQSRLNLLGIFSIALYATVDDALQDPLRSGESYDIALLRQSIDPRQDLIHLWQLYQDIGVRHLFLAGIYSESLERILLRATTSLELPMQEILRLPLRQPALKLALMPYLKPQCASAQGH